MLGLLPFNQLPFCVNMSQLESHCCYFVRRRTTTTTTTAFSHGVSFSRLNHEGCYRTALQHHSTYLSMSFILQTMIRVGMFYLVGKTTADFFFHYLSTFASTPLTRTLCLSASIGNTFYKWNFYGLLFTWLRRVFIQGG